MQRRLFPYGGKIDSVADAAESHATPLPSIVIAGLI
jgi:hypothetical protein